MLCEGPQFLPAYGAIFCVSMVPRAQGYEIAFLHSQAVVFCQRHNVMNLERAGWEGSSCAFKTNAAHVEVSVYNCVSRDLPCLVPAESICLGGLPLGAAPPGLPGARYPRRVYPPAVAAGYCHTGSRPFMFSAPRLHGLGLFLGLNSQIAQIGIFLTREEQRGLRGCPPKTFFRGGWVAAPPPRPRAHRHPPALLSVRPGAGVASGLDGVARSGAPALGAGVPLPWWEIREHPRPLQH